MTKPLEVLEGEGKGGRPQPPAHLPDPRGSLLLVLSFGCSGTPGQDWCLVTSFLQYSETKHKHKLFYWRSPEVPR